MTINNAIITNTALGKRVTIATTNVEYTMNNAIGTPISIPSVDSTNTNATKIVNLLKIVERYVIDGYITTGLNPQAGSPVERTNAQDVRDDLLSISKYRAAKGSTSSWTTLNIEGVDHYVTFEKISIKEAAQDLKGVWVNPITDVETSLGGEAPSGVVRYNVKLSVVVGEPIV